MARQTIAQGATDGVNINIAVLLIKFTLLQDSLGCVSESNICPPQPLPHQKRNPYSSVICAPWWLENENWKMLLLFLCHCQEVLLKKKRISKWHLKAYSKNTSVLLEGGGAVSSAAGPFPPLEENIPFALSLVWPFSPHLLGIQMFGSSHRFVALVS